MPESPPRNTKEKIDHNFAYHKPSHVGVEVAHTTVRDLCRRLALDLTNFVPEGPELKKAIDHVRSAMMWANAGIAVNPTDIGAGGEIVKDFEDE